MQTTRGDSFKEAKGVSEYKMTNNYINSFCFIEEQEEINGADCGFMVLGKQLLI